MSFKKHRIDVISMGCSKNLVDSEQLMKQLDAKGYTLFHNAEMPCGEYVVVNTCGFIGDAKEESINLILQLIELNKEKKIGKIVVMGCLPVRYMDELREELPEVSEWYGKFDWKSFIESIPSLNKATKKKPLYWERILTTPNHSAYIKISEGCNRFCAFCAIPLITGRHTSRRIEDILEETSALVAQGVKEFNIISQDLSAYGTDIYGRNALAELINRMSDIKGVEWIRLHYAYPKDFPEDILDIMNKKKNVCKYLDIAFQHISDNVLNRMQRHFTRRQTIDLIAKIRQKVPDIKLRTTLMVGFPGETENDFKELLDFVKETKFDRMGAFAYCEEDGTFAAINYENNVSEAVKHSRLDKLMEIQQDISYELQQRMIGKRVRVLIDNIVDDEIIGRTQWDSPEVDPEVHIPLSGNYSYKPGDFVEIEITDATEFELYGKLIN